jgi:AraC family transcriptional regulator, regulatory protein of adaptative response / methylated-DNA-[protein]-cysteine methyltransferase
LGPKVKDPLPVGAGVGKMIKTTNIETPLGNMTAAATSKGVCLLAFGDRPELNSELKELEKYLSLPVKPGENRHIRALKRQLKDYFRGKRKEFSLPLLSPGTDFQQEVWNEIMKIPYGTTISYLDLAKAINNPEAVRAVANANGNNRIAIIIPCHRVIGSDGSLVGYGGGLTRKRWLIDHEKKYSGQPVDGILFQ